MELLVVEAAHLLRSTEKQTCRDARGANFEVTSGGTWENHVKRGCRFHPEEDGTLKEVEDHLITGGGARLLAGSCFKDDIEQGGDINGNLLRGLRKSELTGIRGVKVEIILREVGEGSKRGPQTLPTELHEKHSPMKNVTLTNDKKISNFIVSTNIKFGIRNHGESLEEKEMKLCMQTRSSTGGLPIVFEWLEKSTSSAFER
ncbi:hypothetical protein QJS04_geneDACA019502 [Acorus gramineus]|uniref:Uncharacterized protein n=1 Tax=Acorus gramineus TaxID=55184 RepID=A0AAV9A7R6_ACOGR|nr:hypothetical protein QJS04_geneDACA019502 [Acorus gramineus]